MPSPELLNHSDGTSGEETISREVAERRGETTLSARQIEIEKLLARRREEGRAYEQKLEELRARAAAKRADTERQDYVRLLARLPAPDDL